MTALAVAAGGLAAAAVALPLVGAAWTRRAPLAGFSAGGGAGLAGAALATADAQLLLGAWLATAAGAALLLIGSLMWRLLEDR